MTKVCLPLLLWALLPLTSHGADMTDPYLWLEERTGAQAEAWVQSENAHSKNVFESDARFLQSFHELRDIYTSTDKIPVVKIVDGYAYNLWQDEAHKRGVWRRATVQEYKKEQPQWEALLDIDALAAKENMPWVMKSSNFLKDSPLVMINMSRNGQDAGVYREFSLITKDFVAGGFSIPEGKGDFSWVDQDHALVNLTLNDSQKTESGYARQVYYWTRGQDLNQLPFFYEVPATDVSVFSNVVQDGGKNLMTVGRMVNYDLLETFVVDANFQLKKIPLPADTNLSDTYQGQFFFVLRSDWNGFAKGSLVSMPVSTAGSASVDPSLVKAVFVPGPHASFAEITHTRDRLYVMVNENVRGQVYEAAMTPQGAWQLTALFPNSASSMNISGSDENSDTLLIQEDGYLQPRRLILREGDQASEVKKSKSYFNESAFTSEQHWAKSKDGVEIPYTMVHRKDLKLDRKNPTLLYGYGGFDISLTPVYSAGVGKEWLEKGGVYVVANIRGGGEFGPGWHYAAIKENKQKSYDDFIAIAEDLIAKKVTTPSHLGMQGGSNGGLLMGAVAMQRPDLFNAVVCQIPLLDMIRYTKLPPGASWAAEYGDPDDPKMREVILKYSPYQNVSKTKHYPKIFFQTTQADDRVHPGHARKMAARMKEYGHDILFFESTDGGHGGGGVNMDDQARSSAYIFTYLYQQLF